METIRNLHVNESRKDFLRRRKRQQQTKWIRLFIIGAVTLMVLIGGAALVWEYLIVPNRAVAVVHGEPITLSDWQARVVYEREQRVRFLDEQLVALDGDMPVVQRLASSVILNLQDVEGFGEMILRRMVEETAVFQLAQAHNITISEAEIEAAVEANQFNETMHRQIVTARLYQQQLAQQMAVEAGLPTTTEVIGLRYLSFTTRSAAHEAAALIAAEGYLSVWQAIQNRDPAYPAGLAVDLPQRTEGQLVEINGLETAVAATIFTLPLDSPSDILTAPIDEERTLFYIAQVYERTERPLTGQPLNLTLQNNLAEYLITYLEDGLEQTDYWRDHVPDRPALDPKFLQTPNN